MDALGVRGLKFGGAAVGALAGPLIQLRKATDFAYRKERCYGYRAVTDDKSCEVGTAAMKRNSAEEPTIWVVHASPVSRCISTMT